MSDYKLWRLKSKLTYSCDYNDMAILPFSHHGKYSFDNVHIGEEVDLKNLVYKAYGPVALGQFLNGANDSY